jgi:hypothetical protein
MQTTTGPLARIHRFRWWIPLLAFPAAVLLTWNAYWVIRQFIHLAVVWEGSAIDWIHLADASRLPNPYDQEWFRWSPVAAWLLKPITALGITGWRAAQLAALLTLRDRRAILIALATAPFWMDIVSGQAVTFAFVAAWHALRGSRLATVIYFALALLMPRPLMLPVLVWLLWRRPETRAWFLGLLAVNAALVLASGHALDWLTRLTATSSEVGHVNNMAPSRFIGWAWAPIGLALAAILTWRGRLGLASIAASPYVFPYYLLMLILEIARPQLQDAATVPPASPPLAPGRAAPGPPARTGPMTT